MNWLEVRQGDAPLIVSFPHTGTEIPREIEPALTSLWLARKDADWHVERLYDFAAELGATTVRTALSRTVIDVNRDPTGASLYPGQATTGLCPLTTFDGEALYGGIEPSWAEINRRRIAYYEPFHAELASEIERLRKSHKHVVLYEAHSIRSRVPRLFDGDLPNFSIGTNGGSSCDAALTHAVEAACDDSGAFTRTTNGRFKGGWTTRHYGLPKRGVHAIQMELACRGYMDDPEGAVSEANWPTPYNDNRAAAMRARLRAVLESCLAFARSRR